ncbi:sulfite exporter TauE/SafE family protein [Pikeienuella piscinae]|uniref:Probable membrane transporter protein n=1 Tax=Pikeienuella piscinae TaxID=2748098 RepID=A0A7M3T5U2_9RHOB|nr:sulfite exporter TauE/SafE family protein [Pikeienuella piscinae]QIE57373.1 sulfite exporter TauE/SafE family protein [Pikeienuella piscinae]
MFAGWEVGALDAALIALIFCFAGVVKGATGFGLPLTTIALTPLVVPFDLALALNTIVAPLANIAQVVAAGEIGRSLRLCAPAIAGMALTVFVAARLVAAAGPTALGVAMGTLLIAVPALSMIGPRFRTPVAAAAPVGFAAGLAGGVAGAAFTAPGPIFALYFTSLGLDRRFFVSAMGVTAIAAGVLISGAFWSSGILDGPRALMSALAAAPALIGMWGGDRIGRRLPLETFRRLILAMLIGLGLNYFWRAFG